MTRFDVLVIGGGPGGTPAAMALASAGRRVLLVESGAGLGGTCLFEGCIPSKVLHESARRLEAIGRAGEFGLRVPKGAIEVDWSAIMARKGEILRRRAGAALERARAIPTLTVEFGHAELTGARRARIAPREGEVREIEFSAAILATGSIAKPIAVPGIDLRQVLSSERLLEIDRLPHRLVVIGGGPIGVEMAQIFAAFGSAITMLEAGPRILAPVDEEIAAALQLHIRRQGIVLELGAQVIAIERDGELARVRYRDGGGAAREALGDLILEATGRQPNVAGLGLERTAVRFDAHGIKVDAKLETDEGGIYALGDVIGHPMFAHWASAQGLALAAHLLGRPTRFPARAANSAVIFSTPEVATAGLTEAEARAAGRDAAVARYDYRGDARAQVSGAAEGLLKIVYDASSRTVLGVHALVENATSILGEAALAVGAGIGVDALAAAIHAHPTLAESMGVAARGAVAVRMKDAA